MNERLFIAAVAGCVLVASSAVAGHARPGLWNSTTVITLVDQNSGSGQAPPMAMGAKPPAPAPVKVCISPEMAAADTPPKRPGCTYANVRWSGQKGSGTFSCKGLMTGSGTFAVTYTNDKHYEGKSLFASQPVQGKVMKAKTTFSGDWLSADCGAVKPNP